VAAVAERFLEGSYALRERGRVLRGDDGKAKLTKRGEALRSVLRHFALPAKLSGVGLIRFSRRVDYATCFRCSLSNSAGEVYPMAECIRSWL
jgi:hypothetical protein